MARSSKPRDTPRGTTPKKSKSPVEILKKTIYLADVVLHTVDSRYPTPSRLVVKLCKEEGRPLIVIFTKDDLVSLPAQASGIPYAAFSSKDPGKYKKKILSLVYSLARAKKGNQALVRVSVVGYPNAGKSALINAISHRKSLSVSSEAGHTKSVQWIRFGRILLSDTPGVIPERIEKENLVLMGSLNIEKEKDPLSVCETLVSRLFSAEGGREAFFSHFDIPPCKEDEAIESVARRLGRIMKGGEPNILETARMIVSDWQRGKLKL